MVPALPRLPAPDTRARPPPRAPPRSSFLKALDESPETFRKDAAALAAAASGAGGVDALKANEALAKLKERAAGGKLPYSKFLAIGLFRMLARALAPLRRASSPPHTHTRIEPRRSARRRAGAGGRDGAGGAGHACRGGGPAADEGARPAHPLRPGLAGKHARRTLFRFRRAPGEF